MEMGICLISFGCLFSVYLSYSSAVEFSRDGLAIQWVSTCNYDTSTKIVCPDGNLVRILRLIFGTKRFQCTSTSLECCQFNSTSDCFSDNNSYKWLQTSNCQGKSSCDIFQFGGVSLPCGTSTYVAVSFACEKGDPEISTTKGTTTNVTKHEDKSTTVEGMTTTTRSTTTVSRVSITAKHTTTGQPIVTTEHNIKEFYNGLEIRLVSACNYDYDKKIECPYGSLVRIVELVVGTKTPPCSENCCQPDKTVDCFRVSNYMVYQQDLCVNKSVCNIFQSGGIDLGCGISTYVAVGYVCEGGTGPTTVLTTESTTPERKSTNLPREGGIKKDEINLGLALGLSIGCTLLLCVILLIVIYLRYYKGKKDFQRASKTPPSVTQLGIKVDKSDAPVNSVSRFKLDKVLFKNGSWANTGYKQFGISGHNAGITNSYLSPGNLWKQARWLSSDNEYSKFLGPNGTKYAGLQKGSRPFSKGYKEDVDSLGTADDLEALPDISMFSIPDGRHSPDSGLDNIGYILPVIKDQRRDDYEGHLEKLEQAEIQRKVDNNKNEEDRAMVFQPKAQIQDISNSANGVHHASNRNYYDATVLPETVSPIDQHARKDILKTDAMTLLGGGFTQSGMNDDMLY